MDSGGLLGLRQAMAYAATLDARWRVSSVKTFLRFLKLQAVNNPDIIRRFTAHSSSPIYVKKNILRRVLDGEDRTVDQRVDSLFDRISDLEADLAQVRRHMGMPGHHRSVFSGDF
jgi:hypothetical protein